MEADDLKLLVALGLVVLWIAQKVWRSWAQRQTSEQPAESESPYIPSPAPVTRPAEQWSPVQPLPAATPSGPDQHPGWKDLTDEVADLTDRAQRLRDRIKRSAAAVRVKGWIDDFVLRPARRLEKDLGTSGALDEERIGRGRESLDALEQRFAALQVVASQRMEKSDELLVGEMLAEDLFGAFAVERGSEARVVSLVEPVDSATVEGLARMGLLPLTIARGWSKNIEWWPQMVHNWIQYRLARVSGLRMEVFQRFGLAPQWPVPYAEPVYVTANDVLGPFGAWLDVLLVDVAATLLLGPAWARAFQRRLTSGVSAESVLKAPVTRSGYYLGPAPPANLRVALLSHVVERTAGGEAATRLRSEWESGFGPFEGMWMPTRRGSWYGVPAAPYLEAGTGLINVLMDESFAAFQSRRFQELEGMGPWEISSQAVDGWMGSVRSGYPVRGSARLRLAVALTAWMQDPDDAVRVSAAVLAGLVPTYLEAGVAASVPTGRGLLDLRPQALTEALVLQAALGPAGFPWRAAYGFSPRARQRANPFAQS